MPMAPVYAPAPQVYQPIVAPVPEPRVRHAPVLVASVPRNDVELMHVGLRGSVVPFLTSEAMRMHCLNNAEVLTAVSQTPKENLKRLFLGQLPYDVTSAMVTEICLAVTGCAVVNSEVISKKDPTTGVYATTGCCHAYCAPEDADTVLTALHKRILVDVGGIWVCQSAEQTITLKKYVSQIRRTSCPLRFPGLPCAPSTAQVATSQYRGLRHQHGNPGGHM